MILTKVRIKNYKSILDTKEFSLQPDYVVLAGKNESGKSTILKALEKLTSRTFYDNEKPAGTNGEWNPQIIYKFKLTNSEQEELFSSLKINADENDEIVVDITNNSFNMEFGSLQAKVDQYKLNALKDFIKANEIDFDFNDKSCEEMLTIIDNNAFGFVEDKETEEKHNKFIELKTELLSLNDKLIEILNNFIPQIAYHPDFKNILPSSFKKADLNDPTKNIMLKRLENYLNADFCKIFDETNLDNRYSMAESLSKNIDRDFKTIFKQNRVKIILSADQDTMSIRVKDIEINSMGDYEANAIKITERSEGFQWYFNFFITLKGSGLKPGDIILIDEPGVYLHPKAQLDMLDFIREQSRTYQIIFTSHSPYLINKDELSHLRLVEKENLQGENMFKETLVREKIHGAKDKDTLLPIVDAIGYTIPDINLNFHTIIITEGVSDYYYIRKIMEISDIDFSKTNITFANSADKIEDLYSMYLGLGFKNIVVILDSDSKGKQTYRKLKKNLVENVYFINEMQITDETIKGNGFSIEDIFNKQYFKENMLKRFSKLDSSLYETLDFSKSNSEIVKQYEHSNGSTIKWLLSKEFYDSEISEGDNIFIDEANYLIEKLREIQNL